MQGYFTMMMATEVSQCTIPLAMLAEEMEKIGKDMGLSIRVQREDIFEAMHRI
jgi:ACT domain-containing protein